MTPEIGDNFIIDWDKIKKAYPKVIKCLYPNTEFTIRKFSKSLCSVYFVNVRYDSCLCQVCKLNSKSVGVGDIIITKSKKSIDRELKLNQLGI